MTIREKTGLMLQSRTRTLMSGSALAATALLTVAGLVASPAAGAASSNPSGVDLPTAAPRGYTKMFTDNFSGTTLSGRWGRYSGQPGGDPGGLWAPSHVRVSNGMLSLRGYKNSAGKYVTAGVSTEPSFNQKYGKYLVRMRMDAGKGISFVSLLWPTVGSGPPEIDFAEDNGAAARSNISSFLHYGTSATKQQSRRSLAVDMTKWHTLGVEWSPGLLKYTLDGHVWAQVPGNGVSSKSMYLALQTQAWGCGGSYNQCPDSTTPAEVDLDVDWVAAYRIT